MDKRLFHFTDDKSNKFWSITLEDKSHTVHFGKVGSSGQEQRKEFSSQEEAEKSYNKLINEKIKKGYVEVSEEENPLENLKRKLGKFKRKYWKPVTEHGDGHLFSSKFSGLPWLSEDEEWPLCPQCNKPMELFLQLNLREIPEELKGKFGQGLIQLFYCTNTDPHCEVECEAYFPFAKSVLVRLVEPRGDGRKSNVPLKDYLPARLITGWEFMGYDFPGYEEGGEFLEEKGIELDEDEEELFSEELIPMGGDKIGGWPSWIQGVEYPLCPVCNKRMEMVFQIDSEDNLPYMFGDAGCGHITQCRKHKDKLAFGWACG